MARGQQKIQSQQKAQKKADAIRKQQNHVPKGGHSQGIGGTTCTVCKAQMPDPKTYKQHFENKHPKMELPRRPEGGLRHVARSFGDSRGVPLWRPGLVARPPPVFYTPLYSSPPEERKQSS
uniref:Putative secreted salivary gland peptide n=1 Tax=Ixodes ricinus TaxID=34613 RepID=A0A090X964_IXORI